MVDEWRTSRVTLEDIVGHAVTVASVPGGYFSRRVAQSASEAGIELLFTSEPDASLRLIDHCTVAGRFKIRPGMDASVVAAIATLSPLAVWRAWTAWNTKKVIKPFLGAAYPRLGEWIAAGGKPWT